MIDIDKYEGHSAGPWKIEHFPELDPERHHEGTLKLIADAPLLLAEVKRLREETSILKNALRSLLKDKHAEVWYEVNRILEGDEE